MPYRRHRAEIAERRLAPLEELIPLAVALEFELGVEQQRGFRAVLVDLHRVIDDEIDRLERVDLRGITAEGDHGVAHGGQIDHAGHAGEILEEHTRRTERDFLVDRGLHVPVCERFDVGLLDEGIVFAAQEIFEQDAQREGQRPGRTSGEGVESGEPVVGVRAVAHLQRGTAAE